MKKLMVIAAAAAAIMLAGCTTTGESPVSLEELSSGLAQAQAALVQAQGVAQQSADFYATMTHMFDQGLVDQDAVDCAGDACEAADASVQECADCVDDIAAKIRKAGVQ